MSASVLYSIGIVQLESESTSAIILLVLIIPLSFTLSGFLLWIMNSLNGEKAIVIQRFVWFLDIWIATIAHLRARKQRYKLKMFERLHYILLSVVMAIVIFFIISSMSLSGRFAEGICFCPVYFIVVDDIQDYAANTWQTRWWLIDGYLTLLYLAAFTVIIFLWRPSENNRRWV